MKMEAQIRLINIEHIIPNRFQPRLHFNDEGLNDLAQSIKEHGIIQPLVLRRVNDKYEIIAGERRYKAAQMAGYTTVPAIIADLDDNESAEVAVLENTQRRNLSAIEEAKSYKKLLDRKYVTQDQLAKRLGTSQSNIANKIRLLNLDEAVQDALLKEKISERHARSLLKVTDKFKQVDLLNKVIEERWPVKKLDEEIDILLGNYTKQHNSTGAITATNRLDVDVDSIMNNSTDIIVDTPVSNYGYSTRIEDTQKKKNSLFFNNLENESANMDPTLNFGFNPFQTSKINPTAMDSIDDDDDDVDMLNLEGDEQEKETKEKIVEVVKEEKIETMDDAIKAIKNIIKKAQENEVGVELEEFGFDEMYQFIIRIDKEDK